ncbi:MAG TPA: hypothetical protein VJ485_00985 [archaeon]|nr:hypothetical protein [archaeon]
MPRKGAIELSLGFIVTVVFAVVLLSLAIVWLNSIFPTLFGITDDLFQQAQTQIQETFQKSENNFAVWPPKYDLARGRELKMAAGIENDAGDANTHRFVINVIPATASDSVCSGGELDACGNLKAEMQSWITWDRQSSSIEIDRVGYRWIIINPPSSTKLGTYIFNVVACKEPITTASACTLETLNWGGSAQQFQITLK